MLVNAVAVLATSDKLLAERRAPAAVVSPPTLIVHTLYDPAPVCCVTSTTSVVLE
jgi:hypothetical protein